MKDTACRRLWSAAARRRFQRNLSVWFYRNKRAMPWRGVRDAYRVWLSEVMLQQTRVAAVEKYYTRFVRRFPTVRSLARARSEEVLRHWAGLGYYSRARNLHRAAKEIVAQHGGKFPRNFGEAMALPGVGPYTAAAVLSIAYGQRHAVLDGNVARVLARVFALRGDLREPKRWKQLQKIADRQSGVEPPHSNARLRRA
jgi:A/G-specific adenine glycosylase